MYTLKTQSCFLYMKIEQASISYNFVFLARVVKIISGEGKKNKWKKFMSFCFWEKKGKTSTNWSLLFPLIFCLERRKWYEMQFLFISQWYLLMSSFIVFTSKHHFVFLILRWKRAILWSNVVGRETIKM